MTKATHKRPRGGARARASARSPGAGNPSDTLLKRLKSQIEAAKLTHPDRVLYPEQGLTKLDLAAYYVQVGEAMLPHVVDRPLSLVRCPAGIATPCFFQKHRTGKVSSSLASVAVREGSELQQYFAVRDLAGLLALVQLGVLEIHVWGARADDLERPDRIVFDLDPGPGVAWGQIVTAARRLRAELAAFHLKSFVKTTGGKGLHVVAPIERLASWAEVKSFAKGLVEEMARAEPALYTINPSKAKREGRIFLDYLRNDRGATSVAPYSTRARPGAPVALPVGWRDLTTDLREDHFNIRNVPDVLERRGDPWKGFFALRQRLPRVR